CPDHCFNPCSAGSHPLAMPWRTSLAWTPWCFNPCSAGSHPLAGMLPFLRKFQEGFQSLFCWITPSGANAADHHSPEAHVVSFLFLLDHTPLLPPEPPTPVALQQFQSLFCWITPSGIIETFRAFLKSSQFQSLFCWITPSGEGRCYSVTFRFFQFQSLFCWI